MACLMSFGFGQCWKFGERRGVHAPTAIAANYLTISVCVALFLLLQGRFEISAPVAQRGVMIGTFFTVAMLTMTKGLLVADVGPILTSFRLSILVPIVAGVVLWGEDLSVLQVVGIVMAVVGLVLMTLGPKLTGQIVKKQGLWMVVPVFFAQGFSHVGMRSVEYAGLSDQRVPLLCVISFAAGVLGVLVVLFKQHRPTLKDLRTGALIGLWNMFALYAVFTALSILPGTVYYPISGCAIVILDNLAAHFLWKESLSRPAVMGAFLGASSMILVNL